MKKIAILGLLMTGFASISFSQSIIELGVWNNNANFIIEYHQDKVITSTTSGIQFINVANPSSPSPSASLANPANFPMAIEVEGNYAYFGGGMTGYFMISDISNINFPSQIGISYNISGTSYDMAIDGNYAFMPTNTDTLYSIDITDKTTPIVIGKLDLGSFPKGVIVSDNYAFVGTSGGLKVVDISDPLNMNIVTSFGGGYADIAPDLINNRLFVSKTGNGFDAIDISNPTSPVGLFQGIGGSSSGKLVFKDNHIFQLGGGVNAFEVSSSTATYLCSYNSTFNGQINSVTAKDSVFYVSTVNDLHVLKLESNSEVGIDDIYNSPKILLYPNPTNESIKLSGLDNFSFSSITISNYAGKILYENNLSSEKSVVIDVFHLENGVYLLKVANAEEEKYFRFIKN